MDIIENLQQDIRRAREAYRLERTATAHGRLVAAQGDLAVARALIDCGFWPLPAGRFERGGELCGAAARWDRPRRCRQRYSTVAGAVLMRAQAAG